MWEGLRPRSIHPVRFRGNPQSVVVGEPARAVGGCGAGRILYFGLGLTKVVRVGVNSQVER